MNQHTTHQQDFPALADIDYSLYIQRGRQQQARAVREAFIGLSKGLRAAMINVNQYGRRLLAASEQHNIRVTQ